MIASVQTRRSRFPCIVLWTGKTGFVKIECKTYCDELVNAAETLVTQLPDKSKFCPDCVEALAKTEAAIEAANATS